MRGLRGLLFALVVLSPLFAAAQNKEAAKAAYRRGTQHYNLNELPQALEAFKEAYRHFEEPSILFNIGQCQRRLGRNEEAIQSFRAYLRENKAAPNREEVEGLVDKLTEQVKAEQTQKAEAAEKERRAKADAEAAERERQRTLEAQQASLAKAPAAPTPVYKKWWLWTIVGGVVVVGLGVGLGLAFGLPPTDKFGKSSNTTDGTFRF